MSRDPDAADLWPSRRVAPSAVCAAPILVVDDDPVQLRALSALLRAAQLAVATASSGAEALVRASVQRPELVVTEAVLHGASCGPMLGALRALVPNAAIIVLTAVPATDPPLALALRRTRARHLARPIDGDRLIRRLRRALLAGAAGPC